MVNAGMKAKQRLSSKGAKIDAKGTAEKSDGEGDS